MPTRDVPLETLARLRREEYEQSNPTEERRKLAALWRQHYPDAAAEAPSYMQPLVRVDMKQSTDRPQDPDESWTNAIYFVTVRRHRKDPVFGSSGGMIQLGVAALDGTARHDWRDMQAIKTQLAGAETEAFELYPAESRVLDPSNYFMLWCFPGVKRLKIGVDVRDVREADLALAPQRAIRTLESV